MLTPQQAASRTKVSRGTIMKAMKDKGLPARRDNRNRWQIDPADLSKWLSDRSNIAIVKLSVLTVNRCQPLRKT